MLFSHVPGETRTLADINAKYTSHKGLAEHKGRCQNGTRCVAPYREQTTTCSPHCNVHVTRLAGVTVRPTKQRTKTEGKWSIGTARGNSGVTRDCHRHQHEGFCGYKITSNAGMATVGTVVMKVISNSSGARDHGDTKSIRHRCGINCSCKSGAKSKDAILR